MENTIFWHMREYTRDELETLSATLNFLITDYMHMHDDELLDNVLDLYTLKPEMNKLMREFITARNEVYKFINILEYRERERLNELHVKLSNLYVNVERGYIKLDSTIAQNMRLMVNELHTPDDFMRKWWHDEFMKLDNADKFF